MGPAPGLLAGARVEGEEGGRRTHHRQQELAPAHRQATGVPLGALPSQSDRLGDHRREGFRVVLAVRARSELDRQAWVLLVPVRRGALPCVSSMALPTRRPGGAPRSPPVACAAPITGT